MTTGDKPKVATYIRSCVFMKTSIAYESDLKRADYILKNIF